MFAIGQSNFLQALGWAVLNSMWQMALLWVLYQLITGVLKNTKASGKSLLATTLLFTGFGWFLLTFAVTLNDTAAAHRSYSAIIDIARDENIKSWLYTALPFASVAYLVLLIFPIIHFIRNYRYVQVIRTHGLAKASVEWRIFVRNVSERMGIGKPVQVWLSELVHSPVTIGFLKPMILLPVAAVNQLSSSQVEAIILHELSHIRRFDFLLNLLTKAIQTLLYFNPFVKAFVRIVEKEREKHCDEIVLQFQYEPHGYASALLALEKAAHMPHRLAVAAAGDKKRDLLSRVESIMGIRKKQPFSFTRLAGVVAALLCFVSLNVLLIVSKPGESRLKPGLLTNLTVPFHLFTPPSNPMEIDAEQPENRTDLAEVTYTIVNTPAKTNPEDDINNTAAAKDLPAPKAPVAPEGLPVTERVEWPYAFVNFTEKIIPQLAPEQEKQIAQALEASRKVMTEDQWKLVEKNIADALTSDEKEKLKAEYKKAMSELDLEKMEERLKLSFEEINWKQINSQLDCALTEIKLDSLQKVYTVAISQLTNLQKELKEAEQPGIPDTDITLKTLEEQRREAQKAINTIKAVRHRKVVQL